MRKTFLFLALSTAFTVSHADPTWIQVHDKLPFPPRAKMRFAVAQDTLYLIGGKNYSGKANPDVWTTNNGIDWKPVRDVKLESPHLAQGIGFHSQIWIYDLATEKPKAWHSNNGKTWEKTTLEMPALREYCLATLNNKLFLMGGKSDGTVTRDVWVSENGTNWKKTEPTGFYFSARIGSECTTFKDRIYLVGGQYKKNRYYDVWSTADGKQWDLESMQFKMGVFPTNYHVFSANDALWISTEDQLFSSADGRKWNSIHSVLKEEKDRGELAVFGSKIFALSVERSMNRVDTSLMNRLWFMPVKELVIPNDPERQLAEFPE